MTNSKIMTCYEYLQHGMIYDATDSLYENLNQIVLDYVEAEDLYCPRERNNFIKAICRKLLEDQDYKQIFQKWKEDYIYNEFTNKMVERKPLTDITSETTIGYIDVDLTNIYIERLIVKFNIEFEEEFRFCNC